MKIYNPFREQPNTIARLLDVSEIRIHVSRDTRKRALVARIACYVMRPVNRPAAEYLYD